MKPIATYSEATLSGKQKYELYPDKILIKGAVSGSYDFERSFALNKISTDFITLRIRPIVAWIALITSILTGFASFVLVYEIGVSSRALPGVLGIYSGAALIVAIATIKKVEYSRFCSDDYRTVLLSIARSGPDKNQFDSFVQALVNQIREAKETG
ncbi:MAG: hypothetical protein M3R52_03835 [Acidobacteriota bacterium]|nr:hypothetical protein [Acidobacteriota bacterium]